MKCIQYILSFAVVRDDQILMRISGNELTWDQGTCLVLLHTVNAFSMLVWNIVRVSLRKPWLRLHA